MSKDRDDLEARNWVVSPADTITILLPARCIQNGQTVRTSLNSKSAKILRELVIPGPSGAKPQSVKANAGTVFLHYASGIRAITDDKLLYIQFSRHELCDLAEELEMAHYQKG